MKSINAQQVFDYLFQDHEAFKIGNLSAYTHTNTWTYPACLSYVIGDAVFCG